MVGLGKPRQKSRQGVTRIQGVKVGCSLGLGKEDEGTLTGSHKRDEVCASENGDDSWVVLSTFLVDR